MNFRAAVRQGLQTIREPRMTGRGGGFMVGGYNGVGFTHGLPGTNYDYKTAAGERYDNSIVFLALNYLASKTAEATVILQRRRDDAAEGDDDDWETVRPKDEGYEQGRMAIDAWTTPNEEYDSSVSIFGTMLSLITRGNAYLLPRRSTANIIIGYRWIPSFLIRPRADQYNDDGTKTITYYEYRPFGSAELENLAPDQVIHIRNGINPRAPAEGLAELEACLRSICSINELETMEATILHNFAVPGVMFIPKELPSKTSTSGTQLNPGELSKEQRTRLGELWQDLTRDKRGLPFTAPFPMDVHRLSLTPEEMILDKLARLPIATVCASLRLDPLALGLPSESKTFNNFAEAREATYEESIIPRGALIMGQLSRQVLPSYGLDVKKFRLAFDWSSVRAMRPDVDKKHERARNNYLAGGLKLDEFRQDIGRTAVGDAKGEEFYTDLAIQGLPGNEESSGGEPRTAKPKAADNAAPADSAASDKRSKKRLEQRRGKKVRNAITLDALKGELLQKMKQNRHLFEEVQSLADEPE